MFFFSSRKTNSLLENQNCFIDLTFTQLEQEQIKTFCFLFFFGGEGGPRRSSVNKKVTLLQVFTAFWDHISIALNEVGGKIVETTDFTC